MRLSDFENEEALDLLADILDPATEIMADKNVEVMVRGKQPTLKIASYILKNHKGPVIEIVAAMHKEDPKTIKFTPVQLLKDLTDIMNDKDVMSLFTLQGQLTEGDTSGSAMENTEESEQ